MVETKGCYEGQCEDDVDCVWGDWSELGACSVTCGNGFQVRDRGIATAPRNAGKLCEPHDRQEIAPCFAGDCEINCTDGKWSEWSELCCNKVKLSPWNSASWFTRVPSSLLPSSPRIPTSHPLLLPGHVRFGCASMWTGPGDGGR